ncbi:MAG TPA: hypothetical protein VJ987_11655 [Anaerolineales bacterium]|nr:hypothetical protein [Anaerolineales bacterium]
MLDTILEKSTSAIIGAIISVIISNFDRLFKYYKRRVNWFRPEFDLKKGESFDIVTSSFVKNAKMPRGISEEYLREDENVIGDMKPVLIVLQGRNLRTYPYLPDGLPEIRRDESIISFGGEVGNSFTKLVLKKLSCPLRFKGYRIVDNNDNTKFTPKTDKNKRIILDYALIVKTPNPIRIEQNRMVYIFAGVHKPGTLGAAYCTQDRYAALINKAVRGMKAFAILVEIRVDYLGEENITDPIITPKSVVRVYDLPFQHLLSNY